MNLVYCELTSIDSWNTQIEPNLAVLYSALWNIVGEELNYISPHWIYYYSVMIHLKLSRSSNELCVTYGTEYGIKTVEVLTKEASFYNNIKNAQLS